MPLPMRRVHFSNPLQQIWNKSLAHTTLPRYFTCNNVVSTGWSRASPIHFDLKIFRNTFECCFYICQFPQRFGVKVCFVTFENLLVLSVRPAISWHGCFDYNFPTNLINTALLLLKWIAVARSSLLSSKSRDWMANHTAVNIECKPIFHPFICVSSSLSSWCI